MCGTLAVMRAILSAMHKRGGGVDVARGWGLRWLAAGVALLAALALPTSVAGASTPAPPQVQSSSLRQDGQQLVWRVAFAAPFSPGALAQAGGSLCLVIERSGGTVSGQLCVFRGRRALRLTYTAGSGPTGRGRIIAATITRSSDRELSAVFRPTSVGLPYRALRWQVRLLPGGCGDAGGCQADLYPGRPSTARLHTPRLVGCVARGPAFVLHGPSAVHDIALTFDDGPWGSPPTIEFLHVLERAHVPATFFEIGDQVHEFDPTGAIERRMLADGDMIGDHTWSHPDVAGGGSFARGQIAAAAGAIRAATGFQPCLFRAPYGAVSGALIAEARSMGYTTIQWDVDPRDWSLPGTGAIYGNVVANAHNGAIVIQHFGGGPRYETLAALPQEIATLQREHYHFVTVTQMLGYRLVYK